MIEVQISRELARKLWNVYSALIYLFIGWFIVKVSKISICRMLCFKECSVKIIFGIATKIKKRLKLKHHEVWLSFMYKNSLNSEVVAVANILRKCHQLTLWLFVDIFYFFFFYFTNNLYINFSIKYLMFIQIQIRWTSTSVLGNLSSPFTLLLTGKLIFLT